MSEVCAKHVKTPAFIYGACIGCELEGLRAEAQALREEVEALRARVVVTDPVQAFDKFFAESGQSKYRETAWWNFEAGFNLARLNGKTVSEWLLQRLVDFAAAHPSGKGLAAEVGALLSEQEGGKP
ncbi:hypothetical protein I5G21_03055 [Pseudomonas aeruginosa]|nr:hypothetical protein [Pseudomonas aeruginosa]